MGPLPRRFGLDRTSTDDESSSSSEDRTPQASKPKQRWMLYTLCCLSCTAILGVNSYREVYHQVYRRNPQPSGVFAGGIENLEPGAAPDAPVVAFAISLTKLENDESSILDAAEVLLGSIRRICTVSSYRCEPIAFVLPSVPKHRQQLVEDIGWRIMEKDLPVAVEKIEDDFYRGFVVNSGCCGADEFIKLHAYTLTEYHRVLHLDVDTLLLHPMDELMEVEASLLYTTDPAMAMNGQDVMPIQGGFLLVKPDMAVFKRLCDIVRKGNWKKGWGWERSQIGWFYGGATIQGLLPYYYNVLAAGAGVEVNRCIYNHMCDSPECRGEQYIVSAQLERNQSQWQPLHPQAQTQSKIAVVNTTHEGGRSDEGDEKHPSANGNNGNNSNNKSTMSGGGGDDGGVDVVWAIKSVHFTQECPKPWTCYPGGSGRHKVSACPALQMAWYDGRKAVLSARGLPFSEACKRRAYAPIPRDVRETL